MTDRVRVFSCYPPTVEVTGPKRRTRKPRKPTLVSVAKQANKAAIEVKRYEVRPDGSIIIVTGTPDPDTETNPWLVDLEGKHDTH
jgi:hypothetical protein